MMNQLLIENLNNRFDAMKQSLDISDDSYMFAIADYLDLYNKNQKIADVFQEILMEDYIDITILEHMYFLSMLKNISIALRHNTPTETPLYISQEIEEKYKLQRNFVEFWNQEQKRIKVAEKENIKIHEAIIPEDEFIRTLSNEEEFNGIYLIHNKVLEKLQNKQQLSVAFSINTGILTINETKITIKKHSIGFDTLRIIFEDTSKTWQFSEISELFDSTKNEPDKKFYNSIYQINLKLKQKNINDLFITTRQSVQINPKYLH